MQYLAKEVESDRGGPFFANPVLAGDPEKISFLQLIDLKPIDYLHSLPAPTHADVMFYQNNTELDKNHLV